ncbi:MAG TPA: ribonuclease D [Solirubrobacteraceae bacterium]
MTPLSETGDNDTTVVLEEIASRARESGALALDTEFMGEGRYRTLLCLIQIAVAGTGAEQRIDLIDPLKHTGTEKTSSNSTMPTWGGPLAGVLEDPTIEIVVHAGRQDVALLRRALGCRPRNIFDTQVAAGFIGMPAQCSYETLLSETLGVRLAKSASFTRWDARPLTAEQLSYAREDVVHLLELAAEIKRRLAQAGRLEWAHEECEYLERVSDERDLDAIFERLPRMRGLSAASQGIARELVAWRERTAAERDRPVQSVLGDSALVEIAKRKPSSTRKLEDIRGVGQGSMRRRGEEILQAVERGLQRNDAPLESGQRPAHPQPEDAPLIALCEALVRTRARESDLAYELLASRVDLQAIVVGERTATRADVRTLRGWRGELVGQELLALLNGRVSLSVENRLVSVSRI